ncbi:MAG: hypothetical protein WCR40_02255, partial [Candidatus Paceibacterota bacterium]
MTENFESPVNILPINNPKTDIPVPVKESTLEKKEEVVLTKEQQKRIDILKDFLSNGGNINISKIKELELSDNILVSPEIQQAAKEAIIAILTTGENDLKVSLIIKNFKLSDKILSCPEVQQAAVTAMKKSESLTSILRISRKFLLENYDPKDFQEKDDLFFKDKLESLMTYIKHMGDDNFANLFPKTFEKVRTTILENLSSDLNLADYFLENLKLYANKELAGSGTLKAVEHYSVAVKFKNTCSVYSDKQWYSQVLKKADEVISAHPQDGHGKEGFMENDPHENHKWKIDAEQAKKATMLASVLEGNTDKEVTKKLDIDLEKFAPIIESINSIIDSEIFGNFAMDQIKNNPKLNNEDQSVIVESRVESIKMEPLASIMRNLLSRYLIQEVEDLSILEDEKRFKQFFEEKKYRDGSLEIYNPEESEEYDYSRLVQLYETVIRGVLNGGFEKYVKALEVDVPLYDKLYEEFDELREIGRSPLEVYLGRDGIYAYVGRRAQDVSRRRKMGLEGRKKLRENGEVVEINPQYLVYPRYFRDNINYDTKRQFLEQEGISPDADPLFYDTGYTGTIPEQIMEIMDFSEDEIEKRIRLLSAPSAHRRVKGVSENARSEIIEYIEHNSKIEEAAEGLIIDKKTGKIKHIAEPTSPEEQFYYAMVKQAIARHYWVKEKLHHEPSGNVNLDSEHYTIRIRQDYAKLLPQGFLKDPKLFFIEQGKLLKGSKGEGKYPDEEIVLFKLADNTEIVAKRVELRKAKEARKEFSILIAAKKAGLQTADPVGFLS